MSRTVDTSILIYASDAGSPVHQQAAALVRELLRGPELTTLFWPVLQSYLRIVTHPSICLSPLPVAVAQQAVDAVLASPSIRVVGEGENFWRCYNQVGGGRGNEVPDAVIVALMLEHGVSTIYTRDRDFRKYSAISVRDPFAG
ncbi:TA system VapC family ribonuclease toxin [Nocardia iowensis]|uniref:Ribonuclease VapC n=1 Tax=Nocardia iowensis TaxID=204891 RepID=A0ABX8RN21_NOCIO|nr:TA system VapC family ribonuclease toxin [Nocardia iowensis]QXN91045.1 PIN domain-containing protein [Nocardia iowensis]